MRISGNPPDPTPDALLARYRAERRPGDLAALFDVTAPELFRLAIHLCPDAATAEDVLQETFLSVLERASAWDPARPALPWLTGILKNEALMARRRARRRPDPGRLDGPVPPGDPSREAGDAEERERLQTAMRRLPEPYRGVALLRWRHGLEPAAIAEVQGVPPGTVRSWLHRALGRLRVEMGALPALLLLFRQERGIDGVRSAILRRAASQAMIAGSATASAAALGMGGSLMAKSAVVAAAVLLGFGAWLALRTPGEEAPPAASVALGTPGSPRSSARESPSVAGAPAKPEGDAAPAPVDLSACDRDLDLFGLVVDGKGNPVPGASLRSLRRPWRRVATYTSPEYAETVDGPGTTSARDGSFSLRLARGEVVDLLVRAEPFAAAMIPNCPAGERLRVVLREGARLEVVARDFSGAPVAGARILLRGGTVGAGVPLDARGETGADGRCTLAGLAAGDALLVTDHASLGYALPEQVRVPQGGTTAVEVRFPEGRPVSGRVTDAATGKPLAGARVGPGHELHHYETTDADGRYTVPSCWKGIAGWLCAEAPGYGRLVVLVPDRGDADFALMSAYSVAGRVLGLDGAPVEGALVRLSSTAVNPDAPVAPIDLTARSGADGRFKIRDVDPTWPFVLSVAAPGHGRQLSAISLIVGSSGVFNFGDVRLGASRWISGVLVGADGEPMAGVVVKLLAGRGGRTVLDGHDSLNEFRRTDDLGRFAFPDLMPGDYRLRVAEWGAPPIEKAVTLPFDSDLAGVRLEQAGTGVLTVRVRGTGGEPVAGITVNCGVAQARTGDDGCAVFRGIVESKVTVAVQEFPGPGGEPRFLQVPGIDADVSAGEAVITLEEAAAIRGKVLDLAGRPLARMVVMAMRQGGSSGQNAIAQTDESGEFVFRVRRGAAYSVMVGGARYSAGRGPQARSEPSPYRADPRSVEAPAAGTDFFMRELRSVQTLVVRLVDPAGRPVPNFRVRFQYPKGGTMPPLTDTDGRVAFEDLYEEEANLTVDLPPTAAGVPPLLPEGTVLPEQVRLIPRGQEVILRLREGVPITGVVYDPEGRLAEGVRVDLTTADSVKAAGFTGSDGRFRVWIAPGLKLQTAQAWVVDPVRGGERRILGAMDLAGMKGELVFRLEPVKGR